MRKLFIFVLLSISLFASIGTIGSQNVKADDGIEYINGDTYFTQTCPYELRTGYVQKSNYIGSTNYYYRYYRVVEDFVSNGNYYEYRGGTVHYIYDDYAYECYSTEIKSVNINGDAMYNGDYSVVQWEFDFYQIFDENHPFYDEARIFGYGMNKEWILPRVTMDVDGVEETYSLYRSQIVKYDPNLYNEIEFALKTYQIILDDLGDQYDYYADMTEQELRNKYNISNAIESLTTNLYENFITALEDAVVDETCDPLEYLGSHGEYLEDACEVILPYLLENNLSSQSQIETFLDGKTASDLISEEALILVNEIILQATEEFLEGWIEDNITNHVFFDLAEIALYLLTIREFELLSYMTDEVILQIDHISPMFTDDIEHIGENIRIDYVIDIDTQVHVYDPGEFPYYHLLLNEDGEAFNHIDDVDEAVDYLRTTIDEKYASKIIFSYTDVNIVDIKWFRFATFDCDGVVTLLDTNEFIQEFNSHLTRPFAFKPVQVAKGENAEYTLVGHEYSTSLYEDPNKYEYRNRFFRLTPPNDPIKNASFVYSTYYNKVRFKNSFTEVSNDIFSTEIYVYKNNDLVKKLTFTSNNQYKYLYGLSSSTTYTYIAYTTYYNSQTGTLTTYLSEDYYFRTEGTYTPPKPQLEY